MFLKDIDEALVRVGAEITFLRQLVEAQKKEIEQLKKEAQNSGAPKETDAEI